MIGFIKFSNGIVIESLTIEEICKKILEETEKELPKEAHTFEIYNYVFEQCVEKLKQKEILL